METFEVRVNDLLHVQIPDDPQGSLNSRVEDIAGEAITIAWPARQGQPVPVSPQQILQLLFVREDAVYQLTATVQATEETPIPLLRLRRDGPHRRIQRREYFRVRYPLSVRLVSPPEDPSGPGVIETHTEDISGAGIAIRYTAPIQAGTLFHARMVLGNELPPLSIQARVVCCEMLSTEGWTNLYHVRLTFPDITEPQRSRLLRYLNKVQREVLRGRQDEGNA